jgi:hypothetical protein
MSDKEHTALWLWMFILAVVLYFVLGMTGCSNAPVVEQGIPIQVDTPAVGLSWEKNHPERAAWSTLLISKVTENFTTLDKAQDFVRYCPKYKIIPNDQRLLAWSEFFVALAYYESSWNPKDATVDQGENGDLATYSTGLWQVSSVDIQNYGLKQLPKYTYKDLLEVEPNLNLAMALMVRQINKQGLVCVKSDVYWATLSCKLFARYEVNEEIASRVMKLNFCK